MHSPGNKIPANEVEVARKDEFRWIRVPLSCVEIYSKARPHVESKCYIIRNNGRGSNKCHRR